MTNHLQFITIDSRTYCVEFCSSYQRVSDYHVSLRGSLRGSEPARVRVVCPSDSSALPASHVVQEEFDTEKAVRFERDYGFPWRDAVAVVRAAICERFDADTREIVSGGLLAYAEPRVTIRARQLALI